MENDPEFSFRGAGVIVRRAHSADASQLAKVNVNSIRSTYESLVPSSVLGSLSFRDYENRFHQRIVEDRWHIFVVEADGQIMGFTALGDEVEKAGQTLTGQLNVIYLDPQWWRRGVGRLLWNETMAYARQLGWTHLRVKVGTGNSRARRFYEAMGCVADETLVEETAYLGVTLETIQYMLVL
jgi:GNAT superfamily N-acetyltransferase